MIRILRRVVLMAALGLACHAAWGLTAVSPPQLHVGTSTATSAYITFQGLDSAELAVDAWWCGAVLPGVTGGSVTSSDPCRADSMLGRLPCRLDRSCTTRHGGARHFVDLMTVPVAVVRRAYHQAARGGGGIFYYVRRFTGGAAGDRYGVVALQLSSLGVNSPLSLADVRLSFEGSAHAAPVIDVERGRPLPRFGAHINYTGTGTLVGRWELVQPGDPTPEVIDLVPEAALPVDQRVRQRRYLTLQRFHVTLMPNGRIWLPGPDPRRLPQLADGPHLLLLRLEAHQEAASFSTSSTVQAGPVAAFALPVLRVHVGSAPLKAPASPLHPVEVISTAVHGPGTLLTWAELSAAHIYRIEIERPGERLFSALAAAGTQQYAPPGWITAPAPEQGARRPRWRVLAEDVHGTIVGASEWAHLASP